MNGQIHWTLSMKLHMSAWTVLMATAAIVAVLLISWLPGVSVLQALVGLTMLRVAFALAAIWDPRRGRQPGRSGPPGQASGDRFPRRPWPPVPSLSQRLPLPDD